MQEKVCCFTGHRPIKSNFTEKQECFLLRKAISAALDDGFTVFISGMAMGTDIRAAEIVLDLKKTNGSIKLICAVPFKGSEKKWDISWQKRYNDILKNADEVHYICAHYSSSCYHIRNIWMADRSERVIASYNGSPGGTRNTVMYSKQNGKEVFILDESDLEDI